jgi:hypothetical protein
VSLNPRRSAPPLNGHVARAVKEIGSTTLAVLQLCRVIGVLAATRNCELIAVGNSYAGTTSNAYGVSRNTTGAQGGAEVVVTNSLVLVAGAITQVVCIAAWREVGLAERLRNRQMTTFRPTSIRCGRVPWMVTPIRTITQIRRRVLDRTARVSGGERPTEGKA